MVTQKEHDELLHENNKLEHRNEQLQKWLNEERRLLVEAKRRNKALLQEHKRILDLTFEA